MSRTFSSAVSSCHLVQAKLVTPSRAFSHQVLVNSGADESFMDWRLARRLGLSLLPLPKPLEARTLDGRLLCKVTHRTQPIQFIMAEGRTEFLSFHLFNSPSHPLLLGLPWLSKHNPQINWFLERFWVGAGAARLSAFLQSLFRVQ